MIVSIATGTRLGPEGQINSLVPDGLAGHIKAARKSLRDTIAFLSQS
jgi:hypothetical protein